MTFAFGISVVALTFAAWPEENTLRAFTEGLQRAVPGSVPKVYLMDMEHELYYAGRRLGWQMNAASPLAVVFNGRRAHVEVGRSGLRAWLPVVRSLGAHALRRFRASARR